MTTLQTERDKLNEELMVNIVPHHFIFFPLFCLHPNLGYPTQCRGLCLTLKHSDT